MNHYHLKTESVIIIKISAMEEKIFKNQEE